MIAEIWKPKKDYEGLYEVSNLGRVKSLNYRRTGKAELLKPYKTKDGYLKVLLYKDGKRKKILVHRLVAETFLPNPNNLPFINHKDENKTNNFVGTPENDYKDGNLEWCTREYNNNYGTRNERVAKARLKPVLQLSLKGEFIREWKSAKECGWNGYSQSKVCLCCQGKRKSHKGFKWCYA